VRPWIALLTVTVLPFSVILFCNIFVARAASLTTSAKLGRLVLSQFVSCEQTDRQTDRHRDHATSRRSRPFSSVTCSSSGLYSPCSDCARSRPSSPPATRLTLPQHVAYDINKLGTGQSQTLACPAAPLAACVHRISYVDNTNKNWLPASLEGSIN